VVVVSALDGMVTRSRSAEAGVNCYFKKPVDMNALGERVRLVVAQQQELVKARVTGDKTRRTGNLPCEKRRPRPSGCASGNRSRIRRRTCSSSSGCKRRRVTSRCTASSNSRQSSSDGSATACHWSNRFSRAKKRHSRPTRRT